MRTSRSAASHVALPKDCVQERFSNPGTCMESALFEGGGGDKDVMKGDAGGEGRCL